MQNLPTAVRLQTVLIILALSALGSAAGSPPMTLELKDYAAMPITGLLDGKGQTDGMLARVNSLQEEPGGSNRFFINDLNGPLYILDKSARTFTTYLDFNGRDGRPGIFHKLSFDTGFAGGLVSIQFDPDYRTNGRFYTVHIEDPALEGSNLPDSAHFPGLNVRGYETTPAIATPGPIQREGVLIEWTDTNRSNATFEGTARELLRVQLNTRIHPLGALSFNPAARRGDDDWRVLYVGCGDGGAGEARTAIRTNPQRLDTLIGKILRIIPDPGEHKSTSTASENGRYRIPSDNPFVAMPGAREEIWALGLRNPHRLAWAIDPASPRNSRLIANSIGLHTWETVNIIHKGANYGYSLREGNEALLFSNQTAKLPEDDRIPVQISDTGTRGTIVPTYPVIQYGHVPGGGDAIGSGFYYQGRAIPELRGKYLFTDISTGRIWYADYKAMLAADDDDPRTLAEMHEMKIAWDDPNDAPDAGKRVYDSMFPIAQAAYHARGGKDPDLPGRSLVSGDGRADAHVAVDAGGELYIFTKTDGMIRAVLGANVEETRPEFAGVPMAAAGRERAPKAPQRSGAEASAVTRLFAEHPGVPAARFPARWGGSSELVADRTRPQRNTSEFRRDAASVHADRDTFVARVERQTLSQGLRGNRCCNGSQRFSARLCR